MPPLDQRESADRNIGFLLHDVARLTNYFCWHGMTILLGGLAGAFVWAAVDPSAWRVATFATALCFGLGLLNFVMVRATGQKDRHMPQWILFTGLTALSLPGLLA